MEAEQINSCLRYMTTESLSSAAAAAAAATIGTETVPTTTRDNYDLIHIKEKAGFFEQASHVFG